MKINSNTDYAACLQQFCHAVATEQPPVAIYTNNYRSGHVRALANTYPVTHDLLGAEVFASLTWVYTVHYPPLQWDINLYGEDFPSLLLAQKQGIRSTHYNWQHIAGIANLEYLISQLYYAHSTDFNRDNPCVFTIDKGIEPAQTVTVSLQKKHPYAELANGFTIDKPVAIWREGLRIRLANTSGGPLDIQACPGVIRRC